MDEAVSGIMFEQLELVMRLLADSQSGLQSMGPLFGVINDVVPGRSTGLVV